MGLVITRPVMVSIDGGQQRSGQCLFSFFFFSHSNGWCCRLVGLVRLAWFGLVRFWSHKTNVYRFCLSSPICTTYISWRRRWWWMDGWVADGVTCALCFPIHIVGWFVGIMRRSEMIYTDHSYSSRDHASTTSSHLPLSSSSPMSIFTYHHHSPPFGLHQLSMS